MITTRARTIALALLGVLAIAGPVSAAVSEREVELVVEKFKEKDEDMAQLFSNAWGYVVFPSVGKGAMGIGAARGKGLVFEHGVRIGRSTLTQVTIGLQLGGQAYSEVLFLKDQEAFRNFKRGKLKLGAQASAVALTAGAAAHVAYREGVAIVTMAKGGLMYEASVGGQKFSFHDDDED